MFGGHGMLKIGTTLNLNIIHNKKTSTSHTYHCKIIDKNSHYLWIDYPINDATHRTTYFSKGTNVSVSFVGNDNAVYSFQTTLLRKVSLNSVPALLCHLPKTMKRVQRRNYVRIDAALDIAIQYAEEEYFTTVTKDISAGGVAIVMPRDRDLPIHSFVNVNIVLPMQPDEKTYIESKMKVIRMTHHAHIPLVSLQFIDLQSAFKEQIIQYCFKKQREQRIMELS